MSCPGSFGLNLCRARAAVCSIGAGVGSKWRGRPRSGAGYVNFYKPPFNLPGRFNSVRRLGGSLAALLSRASSTGPARPVICFREQDASALIEQAKQHAIAWANKRFAHEADVVRIQPCSSPRFGSSGRSGRSGARNAGGRCGPMASTTAWRGVRRGRGAGMVSPCAKHGKRRSRRCGTHSKLFCDDHSFRFHDGCGTECCAAL